MVTFYIHKVEIEATVT